MSVPNESTNRGAPPPRKRFLLGVLIFTLLLVFFVPLTAALTLFVTFRSVSVANGVPALRNRERVEPFPATMKPKLENVELGASLSDAHEPPAVTQTKQTIPTSTTTRIPPVRLELITTIVGSREGDPQNTKHELIATPVSFRFGEANQSREIVFLLTCINELHAYRSHESAPRRKLEVQPMQKFRTQINNTPVDLEYIGWDMFTGLDILACPYDLNANSLPNQGSVCSIGDKLVAVTDSNEQPVRAISMSSVSMHACSWPNPKISVPFFAINKQLPYGTAIFSGGILSGIVIAKKHTGKRSDAELEENTGILALPVGLLKRAVASVLDDPDGELGQRETEITQYLDSLNKSRKPITSEKGSPAFTPGYSEASDATYTYEPNTDRSDRDAVPSDNRAAMDFPPTRNPPIESSHRQPDQTNPSTIAFDEKDAEFDRQTKELARRFRTGSPKTQMKRREQLDALIKQHFEYRQAQRKREIEKLSSQIDSLRVMIERRQDNMAELIKRRFNDLVDPNSNLDWDEMRSMERRSEVDPIVTTPADFLGVPTPHRPTTNPLKSLNENSEIPGMERRSEVDPIVTTPADSLGVPTPHRPTTNPLKSLNENSEIPDNPMPAEKTFDGTPYSQWLQMLETERMPKKLASAFEACSRLAEPKDEHRIARGIFLAAGLFETGDQMEQQIVWNAATAALYRLEGPSVIDELVNALRNDRDYTKGRVFQCYVLCPTLVPSFQPGTIFTPLSTSIKAELKKRDVEVIQELTRRCSLSDSDTNGLVNEYLVAGACRVWRMADRPLSDFEVLQQLVTKVISNGPRKYTHSTGASFYFTAPEKDILNDVIEKAPETPLLASTLLTHSRKTIEAFRFLGKMKHYAVDAVPILVDQFIEEWNVFEVESDSTWNNDEDKVPQQATLDEQQRQLERHNRRLAIIDALGAIGVGDKGYALLRQLSLVSRPMSKGEDAQQFEVPLFDAVERGLRNFQVPTTESTLTLLSDASLMKGDWNGTIFLLQGVSKGKLLVYRNQLLAMSIETPDGFTSFLGLSGSKNRSSEPMSAVPVPKFEINENAVPKEFSLFDTVLDKGRLQQGGNHTYLEISDTRQLGIYELKETSLRIQLAKPGEPRPTEFVSDKSKLPEGQLLMEFQKQLPPKSKNGANGGGFF